MPALSPAVKEAWIRKPCRRALLSVSVRGAQVDAALFEMEQEHALLAAYTTVAEKLRPGKAPPQQPAA